MRKKIINPAQATAELSDSDWLNIENLAEIEITSEDTAFPIESALLAGNSSGWRAAKPGEQTIRLVFDDPQTIKKIRLQFEEKQLERTQEYVLRWSADGGKSFNEIVRQQWNFSPAGATDEIQELQVELASMNVLELTIIPDISGGSALASLSSLRLA